MKILSFKNYLLFALILLVCFLPSKVYGFNWKEEKSKHFIIQYTNEYYAWIKQVSREAERYYDTIAASIGYSRYTDFWTWDNRVRIIIYPSKETFIRETGQPPWSGGGAMLEHNSVKTKKIVSYKQEQDFFKGVLPHEISHLILREFVGFDKTIPIWFEEGVAQFHEAGKKERAKWLMRNFILSQKNIPIKSFSNYPIHGERDSEKVVAFYAQSVSLVDFLITKYGSRDFGEMCQLLKNGRSFEDALRGAYTGEISSLNELEQKWIKYMTY